jgi:hypothetical protein
MAPLTMSRWCRHCPPVALVALAFFALASSSSTLVWGASIIFSWLFGEKVKKYEFCSILKSSSQDTIDSSLDLWKNFLADK